MKKRMISITLLFIFICIIALFIKLNIQGSNIISNNLKTEQENKETESEMITKLIKEYENNIENFDSISVNEINEKINNEDSFYIYVGRVTCEWCRLFVPILREYATENNIEIFYLDSTETETNMELKNFRETNNIEYVPSLLYYSKETDMKKIEFDITDEKFNKENLAKIISDEIK
jgi:predicted bacteriocin transport accessory protein